MYLLLPTSSPLSSPIVWSEILGKHNLLVAVIDNRLAQQVFLSRLEAPNPYDLAFLRDWFERPNMGNFPLRGPDQEAWNKETETDLLAIRRRSHEDPFSSWFIDTVIPKFHRVFGSRIKVSGIPWHASPLVVTIADLSITRNLYQKLHSQR
jgi:hypothetical protein